MPDSRLVSETQRRRAGLPTYSSELSLSRLLQGVTRSSGETFLNGRSQLYVHDDF